MKGYESIVRSLIEKGFNVNLQNARNSTALQTASHKGYENIVKILLENKANPNFQNLHNSTALHAAVNNGMFVCLLIFYSFKLNFSLIFHFFMFCPL